MDYDYIREEFKGYYLIWKGHMHLADECKETRAQKDQRIHYEGLMDVCYYKMKDYVLSLIGKTAFESIMQFKHEYPALFFDIETIGTWHGRQTHIFCYSQEKKFIGWVYNYKDEKIDPEIEKKMVFTTNFFNLAGLSVYDN